MNTRTIFFSFILFSTLALLGAAGGVQHLPVGTTGQYLSSLGPGSGYIFKTQTAPVHNFITSTGTTTGYLFTISTSTTIGVGQTCTNNGNTYTALAALSAQSGQILYMSGVAAPTASGTLAACTGTTSSITFSANTPLATQNIGATAKAVNICMVGGGGGGGGTSGASNGNSAGGGGGGSWQCFTYDVAHRPTAIYYQIGAGGGGGSSGANNGTNGGMTSFADSNGIIFQVYGGGGGPTGPCNSIGPVWCTGPGGGGAAPIMFSFLGSQISIIGPQVTGMPGGPGVVLAAAQAPGGWGGNSPWGTGAAGGNTSTNGQNASGYGAGGSGASSVSAGGNKAGGNATGGLIDEFELYNGN